MPQGEEIQRQGGEQLSRLGWAACANLGVDSEGREERQKRAPRPQRSWVWSVGAPDAQGRISKKWTKFRNISKKEN